MAQPTQPTILPLRTYRTPSSRDVLAQVIRPTLHRQKWSLDGAQAGNMFRAVHLSTGQGVLVHAEGELVLRAYDAVWLPKGSGRSLAFEAGSSGIVVGISESLVAAAIGDQADSGALRQVTARLCRVSDFEGDASKELMRSLQAIEAEASHSLGGSWHYLTAHLTIALVMLWRMAGQSAAAEDLTPQAERLQHFRHLVETQFRQHWPVSRYASELGLSADRLHDLCIRSFERSPIALIHQRLVREASLLLTGSDLSVDSIAADLGFASASHFSRFFKRWSGLSPKNWREQSRAMAAAGQPRAVTSYADWP